MFPAYSGIFIHILEPVARQLHISRLLAGAERPDMMRRQREQTEEGMFRSQGGVR